MRNYGCLDGIPEAKKIMADIMRVSPENVIVCGNASLNIMYDIVSRSMVFGVSGETPWCKLDKVKFLCPAPGYDRHFAITELFGIEMITIPMTPEGPDMDLVEKYVNNDENVKGIWCVPKYSNPQGITYSDETVKRFAALKENLEEIKKTMSVQTIGHDKLNQLRHTKYFKDINGVYRHMAKHAELLRPKFETVIHKFKEELEDLDIATWTEPKGGYFISFDSIDGCAKAIVEKCKKAGVTLTSAGATYPYKKDPRDCNIRIAPSYPTTDDLTQAAELFVLCVKLVSIDKLLENK